MTASSQREVDRPLHLSAFLMNSLNHIHQGQWRRPDARQHEFNNINLWIDLAKLLEEAKFDAMFFADIIGHYGDADADFSIYVEQGLQIPSNDPLMLMSALAISTENIGLASTSNVHQAHPFQLARQLSTLDHISNGRVAWNVVTGILDNGARNFGLPKLTDHNERYAWADEYVDVAYKLFEGSWDEGALLQDKAGSIHADPSKVHKIYHQGDRYSVEGPHLSSPSPQRTPLLFQAGSSVSGRDFAARNAEAVFLITPTKELARQQIEDTRRRAVEFGRDARDIQFFLGASFVTGDTEEEVQKNLTYHEQFINIEGYLAHSALVDQQGKVYPPNTPLKDAASNTRKGYSEWIAKSITDREPVVADIAWRTLRDNLIIGTPEQIADELAEWQAAGVDGINVMNWVIPGSYEEFAEKVVPVLQKRGLTQTQYTPGTLRSKLFGRDHLPSTHPAAKYRNSFSTTN